MNPIQIRIEDMNDYVIMFLSGTGQAVNNQDEEIINMRNTFKKLASDNKTKLAINLKDVEYLSSSTIGALLSGNSIIKKAGGKVVLYNASSYIMDLFNIVKLSQVIPVCKTLEETLVVLNIS